jgi:hypothetical protein
VTSPYEEAVAVLRAWTGATVAIELLPEGTVLRGRLAELDPTGIDGALFALGEGDGGESGVALALFRDAVEEARREGEELRVRQGQMTHVVRRA